MKRILHLSDLHFGRIHPPALESLQQFLSQQKNSLDLIVSTGDWTQRARHAQFREAAAFLKSLSTPVLSVPGNHDIPLYDLFTRLLWPLKRYETYIGAHTSSEYQDEEVVIVGLTTPHATRSVEGLLGSEDVRRAREKFEAAGPNRVRILAGHHPLCSTSGEAKIRPLRRVRELLALRPHIMLSGHFHSDWCEVVKTAGGHRVLHLAAGTAVSSRLRGKANGFHLLSLEGFQADVTTFSLSENGFLAPEAARRFELS